MYYAWIITYSLKVIALNSKPDGDMLPPVLSEKLTTL